AISRNLEKLMELEKKSAQIRSEKKLMIIKGDVADERSVVEIAAKIKSAFQNVDVLINNAGVLINKPFGDLTGDDWKEVYATNVFVAVNMSRSMITLMNQGSHIVIITIMCGVQGRMMIIGLSH